MADTSAISALGQAQPQQNPLGLVQGYAALQNTLTANKLQQQDLQIKQQGLSQTRSNRMAQQLYAINTLPDDQVSGQAQSIIDNALTTGDIDQTHHDIASKIIASGNPSAIRQFATLGLVGTLAGPEAVHMVAGVPYVMANGQQNQPGMIAGPLAQNHGQFTPSGPATQVYPSRETLLTQQPGVDEDNNPTNETLAGRANSQGAGGLTGPAGQPPRLPGAVQAPPGGNAAPSGQPSSAPAPQPSVGGFTPTRTGLAPGADIPLKASNEQFANDRAAAGTFASRTFPLQAAISLYKNGTTTGPGSDFVNNLKSFVLSRAENLGLDPNKVSVANFDELNKYLTQIATSNPMAGGSDARLAAALTGNPSTHISTLAGQNVARAALALERMKQSAIVGYNGNPAGYANYLQNYATHVDPRAFAVDMMSPDEQQKMFASMKPTERAQFKQSYEHARDQGLLQTTAMPANQ